MGLKISKSGWRQPASENFGGCKDRNTHIDFSKLQNHDSVAQDENNYAGLFNLRSNRLSGINHISATNA